MHLGHKQFNTELGDYATVGRTEGVREVATRDQGSWQEAQRVSCEDHSQKTRMWVKEPKLRGKSTKMHMSIK